MNNIINIIIGFLTAGIVQLLKKIKLPAKVTPIIVLIVAILLVSVATALGFQTDVQSMVDAFIKALSIAGVTALSYDQIKKMIAK